MSPNASAWFPVIRLYVPGARTAGFTSKAESSAVSPKACPALSAAMLPWASAGFFANFYSSHSTVGSRGLLYIHESTPSANMFLDRSASFFVSPASLTASTVMAVIGISNTW